MGFILSREKLKGFTFFFFFFFFHTYQHMLIFMSSNFCFYGAYLSFQL